MIDQIIASAGDINLQIHAIPFFKDLLSIDKVKEVDSSVQSSKKSGPTSNIYY